MGHGLKNVRTTELAMQHDVSQQTVLSKREDESISMPVNQFLWTRCRSKSEFYLMQALYFQDNNFCLDFDETVQQRVTPCNRFYSCWGWPQRAIKAIRYSLNNAMTNQRKIFSMWALDYGLENWAQCQSSQCVGALCSVLPAPCPSIPGSAGGAQGGHTTNPEHRLGKFSSHSRFPLKVPATKQRGWSYTVAQPKFRHLRLLISQEVLAQELRSCQFSF